MGEVRPKGKQPGSKVVEGWFEAASVHLYRFCVAKKLLATRVDWSYRTWSGFVDDGTLFDFLLKNGVEVCKNGGGVPVFKNLLRKWLQLQVELDEWAQLAPPSAPAGHVTGAHRT